MEKEGEGGRVMERDGEKGRKIEKGGERWKEIYIYIYILPYLTGSTAVGHF